MVTILALAVSLALIVLTNNFHQSTISLAYSVESVRLAEEAEVDLLLYARASGALVRQDIAGDLRAQLLEARRYVTSLQESRALAEADARIHTFLDTSREAAPSSAEYAARENAAYDALEMLINVNVEESKNLQARATRWDQIGNQLGIVISILLLGVALALIWWLRTRAFQPVLDLAAAMGRFGRGERGTRAPETGPAELREMVVRFNQMAAALDAQYGAQTAFLGGVAHDLRTPLMVLMLQLEMVRPDKPLPPEPRLRRTLEIVGRQIIRLERMLGDLVDIAKIESGALDLKLVRTDIRQLVADVVDLFEGSSPDHQIRVALPNEAVMVQCDPLRVEQVVTNLLSNAIKYSPQGGPVEVVVEQNHHEVLTQITDHGIGMTSEDSRRLFEPFRRVGLSAESVPGVGLGLYVVRRIVEGHHGRVEVESEVGKGSSFRIYLPIA